MTDKPSLKPATVDDVMHAVRQSERRLSELIENRRSHEIVAVDGMVDDVKHIRRTVDWLKKQWEKFARGPF
jgi:ubiquinone biosynthesis protein UbiJ